MNVDVRQVVKRSSTKTFGEIWESLKETYRRNERCLSRAYGYLGDVETLYAETMKDAPVYRVHLTNRVVDRASKRDILIAASRVNVFYAVLTLAPALVDDSPTSDWIRESVFFSHRDIESAERIVYGSRIAANGSRRNPTLAGAVNEYSAIDEFSNETSLFLWEHHDSLNEGT